MAKSEPKTPIRRPVTASKIEIRESENKDHPDPKKKEN